jgi:four helix bundle protein
MFSLHTLDVYRCSLEFAEVAHRVTERCPAGHKELGDQLRRAAPSIVLNLAEGNSKKGKDGRRYYESARASVAECRAIFDLCGLYGLLREDEKARADELLERIMAMLTAMARK